MSNDKNTMKIEILLRADSITEETKINVKNDFDFVEREREQKHTHTQVLEQGF